MGKKIVYHGSSICVATPNISYSRTDIDFGAGFYVTEDETMAKKWACNKENSVLNIYTVDLEGLRVKELNADSEWLQYVLYYRNEAGELPFDDTQYDVIIGPTADDKLFNTIDMYNDGYLSEEQAIKMINCMNYSSQIVFKKQITLDKHLDFMESKVIQGEEKQTMKEQFRADRKVANERSKEILKIFHGR